MDLDIRTGTLSHSGCQFILLACNFLKLSINRSLLLVYLKDLLLLSLVYTVLLALNQKLAHLFHEVSYLILSLLLIMKETAVFLIFTDFEACMDYAPALSEVTYILDFHTLKAVHLASDHTALPALCIYHA